MPMLTFTSSLALERENPLRQPKAENRETDCSEFLNSSLSFLLVGFQHRQQQHNRWRTSRIPLGPVVWLSGNASHLPQAFCLRHKPPRLRQQRRA